MPDAVTHPTTQELAAFGLGKLPERIAAAVAAHLESCPACRKVVANVSPDSFLAKVRDARPNDSSFPPGLARPAIPHASIPNVPPELARHPKYLILRELGRGGMGVVYQARHKEMDRQVVIKVINRSLLDRPDTLERFQREVRAAALLSHPNIVTAFDAEQIGESHMLVMEFVPGQSLAEVVQKRGPLPVEFACHFARQVALGLQHAHERNMVHRDIKPQNLMLSLKNQIKILDFGLAKVMREAGTGTGLTSHDAFMGTPDYCAPEQATDARTADIRADLYSLGCTLYYLLSGRPPFHEDTFVKIVLAHQQKQPQPLPELRADVPAELWQVVARLLAKEPGQRYQKPNEVFRALSVFVKAGAKSETKSGSMLPSAVGSPNKGTVIAADTGEIQKILRHVPGKAPPKKAPAKDESSPFADLRNAGAAPKEVVRASRADDRSLAAWWKRPRVLATAVGVSLALTLIAVIIIKLKTPEGTIVIEDLPANAEVMIDGITVTVKPVEGRTVEIRVAASKKHRLEVKINDTKIYGEEVEIDAGGRQPIRVRFQPAVVVDGNRPPAAEPAPDENGFVSLFNGKDLNGWKKHPKQPGNWRVIEDTKGNVLTSTGAFASYLYSQRGDYQDFRLLIETRVNDDGNGGVYIRAPFGPQVPETKPWPIGYEALINSTRRDLNKTGTLYVGGEGARFHSKGAVPIPYDQWFWMKVIAEGNHITVKVNDKLTADYIDEKRRFTSGHIALEQFGAASKIEFRTIKIKELPVTKVGAPPATKAEAPSAPRTADGKGFAPLFTKSQLSEWLVAPDKSDKTQGKEVKLRDGLIVLDKPGSLLVTKKADFKNVEFTVEFAASEGTEAFVGVHLQQREATWGNKTSRIFDNGSKILAGMQQRKFGRNEMGIKRAQLDYDQFFTMRIRVKDNEMNIFVNGAQTGVPHEKWARG